MRIGRASGNDRVVASHSIARRAFALSMVFALVAAAWAVVILTTGGSWWGPLHSFLAGTILLAISGASQMFTVTWATTTPPSARITGTQRWLMALGVAAVLVGVAGTIEALVTDRERAVAALCATGGSSRHIADALDISVRTVDNLLGRIYRKCGFSGRAALRAWCAD